jgi:glycosyltransferase involved in cell wall biosynthesis
MRILFVAPQVPWPANKGDRQRSYALLRALAAQHEVTLTAPADQNEADACADKLRTIVKDFIPVSADMAERAKIPDSAWRWDRFPAYAWDLMTDRTPYEFRYNSDRYASVLRPHHGEFDAVFCRYLRTLPVVRGFPRGRIVLDADDLHYLGIFRSSLRLSHGWSSPLRLPEAARSYVYEQGTFRNLAQVLVCSDVDCARVLSGRKAIVRNGIDRPAPQHVRDFPDPDTIIFVGQMTYGPNVEALRWFLRRVWPHLRSLSPRVRLLVVGRAAGPDSIPFARTEGVEIVGEVAETASWISSAMLSVAPLRVGMGTRIKILESLACGRPVIATRIGAEGLDDINEQSGLFREDDPHGMAQRISSLLLDRGAVMTLGARGRAIVESRYTWEVTTRQLAADVERWTSLECDHPRRCRRPAGAPGQQPVP